MADLMAQCSLPPVLLALVSFFQRRHGPALGGVLAGLPLSSGPVVLLTALHGGDVLAARTALTTLEGVAPVCVLCLVLARAADRLGPRAATGAGVAAFLVAAGVLEATGAGPGVAVPLGVGVLTAAAVSWPAGAGAAAAGGGGLSLGVRMVLVTGYVVLVCALTWRLGPGRVGPFAPFPVLVVTQAAQTLRAQGAPAASAFLRGVLRSEWGFVASFLLLAACLPRVGVAAGFALALAGGAVVQAVATGVERRASGVRAGRSRG